MLSSHTIPGWFYIYWPTQLVKFSSDCRELLALTSDSDEDSGEEEEVPIDMSRPSIEQLLALMMKQTIDEKKAKGKRRKLKGKRRKKEKQLEQLERERIEEKERKEHERFEKQLSLLQQQITNNIESQKSQREKLAKETERKDQLARANRLEEKADRIAKTPLPMKPGEDLYSAMIRFERIMVNKDAESFQWVPLLEHALTGSHLNTYHAHVDSCRGKYGDLKAVLLDAGGFNIHECLDTFLSHFRPGGSLSASQWSQLSAHRIFIALRKCLELNHLADSDLKAVASAISSCSVLSTLPREGRAFVFTSEPKTAHDRVLAYWQYNGKPQNVDRPYRTYRHEHERVPADKFHNRRKFPSSNSYNSEARFQSHRTSIESGTSETTFPVTCFKCNNEGHYADRCPERRTNSVSTPSVSLRTAENKPPASTSSSSTNSGTSINQKKDNDKSVSYIVSDVSDDGCTETLPDCLNVKDGAPRKFNGVLNGNINGFPCTLRLDSGADVSVISADLVKPDDSIVAHTVIMGLDHIKHKVPKYCLPFNSYDVSGNCLFAVYDKLPAKYALIGCDLGNTFHELLSIAMPSPTVCY